MIRACCIVLFFACMTLAAPAGTLSKIIPLPENISDSLPWFAVREWGGVNAPFTKVHLQKMAASSNRVALVYFATWCVPCREGIARIVRNREQLNRQGLKVVFVNVGERDEELVKKWISKMDLQGWNIVMDPFGRMTEGFGLVGENARMDLPKTLVLDKETSPLFLLGQEGDDFPEVLWKGGPRKEK